MMKNRIVGLLLVGLMAGGVGLVAMTSQQAVLKRSQSAASIPTGTVVTPAPTLARRASSGSLHVAGSTPVIARQQSSLHDGDGSQGAADNSATAAPGTAQNMPAAAAIARFGSRVASKIIARRPGTPGATDGLDAGGVASDVSDAFVPVVAAAGPAGTAVKTPRVATAATQRFQSLVGKGVQRQASLDDALQQTVHQAVAAKPGRSSELLGLSAANQPTVASKPRLKSVIGRVIASDPVQAAVAAKTDKTAKLQNQFISLAAGAQSNRSAELLGLSGLQGKLQGKAATITGLRSGIAQTQSDFEKEKVRLQAKLDGANNDKPTGFFGRFKKTAKQEVEAELATLQDNNTKALKAQEKALAREAKAAEALAKQAAEKVEKKQAALRTLETKYGAAAQAEKEAKDALDALSPKASQKQFKAALLKYQAAKAKATAAKASADIFGAELTALSKQAEAAKKTLATAVDGVSVSSGLLGRKKVTLTADAIAGVKTRQQVKDAKALEKRNKADVAAAEAQTSADTALAGLRTAREKKQDAADAAELAMLRKRAKEQEIAKRLTDRENANKEKIKTEAAKLGLGAAPTKKQLAAKEAELNTNLEVIQKMQNLTKGDQLTKEQHGARAALQDQIKALEGIRQLRAKKITVTEDDILAGNAAASQVKMAEGKKAEIGVIADLMRKKGMETAAVPETRDISDMRAATGIGGFARRAIVRVTPGVSPEFALKKMTEAEKKAADTKKREAATARAQANEDAAIAAAAAPAVATRPAAVEAPSAQPSARAPVAASVDSAPSTSISTPAAAAAAAEVVSAPVAASGAASAKPAAAAAVVSSAVVPSAQSSASTLATAQQRGRSLPVEISEMPVIAALD